MISKENIALAFVKTFIEKANIDDKEIITFDFYTDPSMRKQRRFGWYGSAKYIDGTEIASSLDVLMRDIGAGSSLEDIKNYEIEALDLMNRYMKDYVQSISYVNWFNNLKISELLKV